jgi:hypothetical protein
MRSRRTGRGYVIRHTFNFFNLVPIVSVSIRTHHDGSTAAIGGVIEAQVPTVLAIDFPEDVN